MGAVLRFLSYNNAVPIALSILIVGGTGAFAATNPDAVYTEKQTVVSVDNTYIANKDLSQYSPAIQILEVTEDADTMYVAYQFSTIDVEDATWKDVVKKDVLKVPKASLGESQDLGLYATEQFKQLVDHELERLKETQQLERRNVTSKIVSTEYSGLVGKLLDAKTETLPGYVPVVTPQDNTLTEETAAVSVAVDDGYLSPAERIQVLGVNPVRIDTNTLYVDRGVFVADKHFQQFSVQTFVNDVEAHGITIDTSEPGTWTIRYLVKDADGQSLSATRTVIVVPSATYQSPASTTQPTTTTTP